MISKKAQAVTGIIAFGFVISLAYQNCNSGMLSQRSTGFTAVETEVENQDNVQLNTVDCEATVQSWQVGSTGCSFSTGKIADGAEQLLIDNVAPTTGQATFRCVRGSLQLASELPQVCNMQVDNSRTNGECGTLQNQTVANMNQPTSTQLCTAGTSSIVMTTGETGWSWSCNGIGSGSSNAQCQSFKQGTSGTAGDCGTADGRSFAAAPTSGLCTTGNPNPATLSGAGPWNWTCRGINGGANSGTCTAQVQSTGGGGGGGGGEVPRCGAATTGNSGPRTVSEFGPNDYCFTGTSVVEGFTGSGPWAWYCKNPSTGERSAQCKSIFPSTESCPSGAVGVATGTKNCTTIYGEAKTCGTCVPTTCSTGYQLSGSPASCVPLFTGRCQVPAGQITFQNSNTHPARGCETNVAAKSYDVGNTDTLRCSNAYNTVAMKIRCVADRTSDPRYNGGAPYDVKRLENFHGRTSTSESDNRNWETLTFSGAINIQEGFTYHATCRSSPAAELDGEYLVPSGGISGNSSKKYYSSCLYNRDAGTLHLVYIYCDGFPAYNDYYPTWKIDWEKPAVKGTGADTNRCYYNKGLASEKSSGIGTWVQTTNPN